jgi:hypothetical protein
MFHIVCHIAKYPILRFICNQRVNQNKGKVEYSTARWGLFDFMGRWDNTSFSQLMGSPTGCWTLLWGCYRDIVGVVANFKDHLVRANFQHDSRINKGTDHHRQVINDSHAVGRIILVENLCDFE